ncbi:MAG: hypothetical protein ACL7BU_09040 [Candidatus Phlomobacter fragariae]
MQIYKVVLILTMLIYKEKVLLICHPNIRLKMNIAPRLIYAKDMGLWIKGLVHEADAFYGISEAPAGQLNGIAKALKHLRAGYVFIYELQSIGPRNKYVPADYQKAVWDITKETTDAGIIVIIAAGDDAEDLDHKL